MNKNAMHLPGHILVIQNYLPIQYCEFLLSIQLLCSKQFMYLLCNLRFFCPSIQPHLCIFYPSIFILVSCFPLHQSICWSIPSATPSKLQFYSSLHLPVNQSTTQMVHRKIKPDAAKPFGKTEAAKRTLDSLDDDDLLQALFCTDMHSFVSMVRKGQSLDSYGCIFMYATRIVKGWDGVNEY